MPTFSELATAAYCPRQLYYRRRDDAGPPPRVETIRALAYRYPELLHRGTDLSAEPVEPSPAEYRANLAQSRARIDAWPALAEPARRDVSLVGKDCSGTAHKLVGSPPAPSIISTGAPPTNGVWKPHGVRATAAAKALAWERSEPVEQAYVEYPAYGVVRAIRLSSRRKAQYRRVLRTVETLDGPPRRLHDAAKCGACDYRARCGATTRSLQSRR